MERRKKGIFEDEKNVRDTFRGSFVPNMGGSSNQKNSLQSLNPERQMNVVMAWKKFRINLKLDTQKDLNDNIIPIVQLTGNTGAMHLRASVPFLEKIKEIRDIVTSSRQ